MKKAIAILVAVLVAVGLFAGGWWLGQETAEPKAPEKAVVTYPTVFYATVSRVSGNTLLVKGLEVNDRNFRGEFTFSLTDTEVWWRYEQQTTDKLQPGQRIAVYSVGEIEETYPAGLTNVPRVDILEDTM